jgi:peptide/nickel transport system permease protein
MGAYVIRRLLWIPVTLILVSIVVFLLNRWLPGSVIDQMVSSMSPASSTIKIDRHAIEVMLGLDKPVYVQYFKWISNIVLHGDMGNSLRSNFNVSQEIFRRLPVTLELAILALLVGGLISIPVGVYAAIRQDTVQDYVFRSLAIILISVPSFWLGTMIMIYPSIWWHWSPSMEYITFLKDPIGNLSMFIIPAAILGTGLAGSSMRMTRAMMLEVLRQDYTRTAWAKGLTERVIVLRHALKNALIPVITIVGVQLPVLIGGAVIIEQIFSLPGLGRLMLTALQQRDYTVVQGINLMFSVIVIFVNLFVDLGYGWMDPRIQYQ